MFKEKDNVDLKNKTKEIKTHKAKQIIKQAGALADPEGRVYFEITN